VAWRERIDPNPFRSELARHAPGHLQYRRFARVVRHPGVVLRFRSDGGVSDGARALHLLLQHTLFVMEPLIEAIRMMLPLFPNLAICLPAACAVNSTPFVLTSIT
jgi:hypothetical protein